MRLTLLTLLLVLAAGCAAGDGPAASGEASLRVVTLNIWNDQDDWPARLERIVEEMRALDPDVICLQEVLQNAELPNQSETLAGRLEGYEAYFTSVDSAGSPKRYGNAILTRLPILVTGWKPLYPSQDYRTAAYVRVLQGERVVDVYDTHLHHTPAGDTIRAAQLDDLARFVAVTRDDDAPTVVCGDFNARADAPEMQAFTAEYADAYAALHPDAVGGGPATFRGGDSATQRRIDHIFYQGGLKPAEADVVFDEAGAGGVWASDHFGVFVRFTFTDPDTL